MILSATAAAWLLAVVALVLLALLLIALGGNAHLAEENRRLRRVLRPHLNHPSNRRTAR